MVSKSTLQCEIRPYRPTDKEAILSLFRFGVMEHIYPAFFKAMSNPDHMGVTLSISMAGYVLGGSSYFMALLAGGAWAALIYFCCYEIYSSYLRECLCSDMGDIQGYYLGGPDSCLWVAEAEVRGRLRVVGMVAVVGRVEEKERNDSANGRIDGGDGSYAQVTQTVVSFPRRRHGLGTRLAETALDFCRDRGFGRVVLETSSAQTSALALYRKLGFEHTLTRANTRVHRWVSSLARVTVLRMEMLL